MSVKVAALTSVLFLIAVVGADPAFAKRKKKGKHGPRSAHAAAVASSKRIAIMGADEKPSEDKPVRAQLAKVLKKHKIKVAAKARTSEAPSDEQGWLALGLKLKVDGFLVPAYDSADDGNEASTEPKGKTRKKAKGKKAKKNRSVEIVVRTAKDGSVVATETFTAKGAPKKLAAAVGKGFWKQLGTSVEQVSAPAPGQEGTGMPARDLSREPAAEDAKPSESAAPVAVDEKEPASSPTEAPPASPSGTVTSPLPTEETAAAGEPAGAATADEDDDKAGASAPVAAAGAPGTRDTEARPRKATGSALGPKLPALSVRLVGRFVSRSFVYTSSAGVPSSSATSPTLGAGASWFPITFVGVAVNGELASWSKFGGRYPTVTSDLTGALAVRIPLSFGELTGHAGAFRHIFAIQDDGTGTRTDQVVPDLVYVGLRAGGGVTYHVTGSLTAAAEASYRLITNMNGGPYAVTNDLYFPKAAPGPGLDLALTVTYRITPTLEALAGFDVRRYILTTSGDSNSRVNATYLTDQSLAGWIGLGAVFGGT